MDLGILIGGRAVTSAPVRRGLVLGAGAALGAAWSIGALCALSSVEGYDPLTVDVVVGTSAGSVLAALLACGVDAEESARRLDEGAQPHVEGTAPVNAFDVHASLARIPRPVPLSGNLRLAANTLIRPGRYTLMTAAAGLAPRGRGTLAPLAELIAAAQAGRDWPTLPRTWVVAMDFDSGHRVVFGRSGAPRVQLPDAVVASCSAPGFFPPSVIGGRRYVDGGAVSVTNADVLSREGLDEILILAPMATFARDSGWSVMGRLEGRLRNHGARRLAFEVAQLEASGATVRVLAPSVDDLRAMGPNMMNPARRQEVLHTARRTTAQELIERPVGHFSRG